MNERVSAILNGIIERFKQPETLPEAIAHATFPYPDIPSYNWSLLNRILIILAETNDARGFRQWNTVGRRVKKGAKAIFILAPVIRSIRKTEGDHYEEKFLLKGFRSVPVFRVEDTEGEPINYKTCELPALPLLEKAQQWGITVKATFRNNRYLGCYSPKREEIRLASPDEIVFFHELSHAAHGKVLGKLKMGQDWKQEIVAELSAQALCYLVGSKPEQTLGNSYRYIERYAQANKLSAASACIKILSDVEKVLNLILTP